MGLTHADHSWHFTLLFNIMSLKYLTDGRHGLRLGSTADWLISLFLSFFGAVVYVVKIVSNGHKSKYTIRLCIFNV